MKTYTIQTAATTVIVLALVLGVLGTSPSTPNTASHLNTSEIKSRPDSARADWSWILKAPVRVAPEN
ncbi:MAG: hypothetical protein ACU84Q_18105 [Gammaproteobacteria bacterium]